MSTSVKYQPVTHCIFDMDGLLLDTEIIYEEQVHKLCRSFGKVYTMDIKKKVLGTTEQNTATVIVNEVPLPMTLPEYTEFINEAVHKEHIKKTVRLMKGAEKLIRYLHEHDIPFCMATSSREDTAESKMQSHPELFKLFYHFVMASTDPEVKQGKPAPDVFLIAAKRFRDAPDPSKCLVFEDSPNGVKAAKAAGMQVVMVPNKELTPPEKTTEATIVLDSLEEFCPELFGLPQISN